MLLNVQMPDDLLLIACSMCPVLSVALELNKINIQVVSNFRDTNLINSKNVAQPSDFSAFMCRFHENTLAASYSVKVQIFWPEDGVDIN